MSQKTRTPIEWWSIFFLEPRLGCHFVNLRNYWLISHVAAEAKMGSGRVAEAPRAHGPPVVARAFKKLQVSFLVHNGVMDAAFIPGRCIGAG